MQFPTLASWKKNESDFVEQRRFENKGSHASNSKESKWQKVTNTNSIQSLTYHYEEGSLRPITL